MAEINEALRGMAPGEVRRFRKSFPDDFANDEFKGKTLDYEVTLVALKEKKLPELNDELARLVNAPEGLESLREQHPDAAAPGEGSRPEKEVPAVDPRRRCSRGPRSPRRRSSSSRRRRARCATTRATWPPTAWIPRKPTGRSCGSTRVPGAERRVREYLLLDAIANREGIEISDTEVEAEFKRAAARRGVDPAALREEMARADGLGALPGRTSALADARPLDRRQPGCYPQGSRSR